MSGLNLRSILFIKRLQLVNESVGVTCMWRIYFFVLSLMALDMDKMKEPLDDLCKRTSIVKSINILDRLRGETYYLKNIVTGENCKWSFALNWQKQKEKCNTEE